jgi:hypothetical protein
MQSDAFFKGNIKKKEEMAKGFSKDKCALVSMVSRVGTSLLAIKSYFKGQSLNFMCTLCVSSKLLAEKNQNYANVTTIL